MKLMRKMVGPVIWAIVITSALWSVQGVITGLSGNARGVGRAFGKIVTFKEYDDAFKSTQLLTKNSDRTPPTSEELEDATWQHIIFDREAAKERIAVGDAEVIAEISRLTGGQVLSAEAYDDLIRRNFNEQPRNFEERIRTILKIRKLYANHQNAASSATDDEVRQFYLNDQSKITVEYIQLKTEDEAKQFKNRVLDLTAWDEEKKKEAKRIVPLGPVNLDIFITVVGVAQADVDSLLKLEAGKLSDITKTKTGYAIFHVTQKELAAADQLDANQLQDYRTRLIEQKKQTAFLDWWNDVMKRSKVEKFKSSQQPS